MSFKDVISEKLLIGFSEADLSVAEILLTLGITFLIAIYLYIVYRLITENAFYAKNFNISMVAMALVTSGIVMAMQSSLVISLGMVGALSIVRFRTAIKEPMDLLFLFWSIGTGIICGAGLYKVAVILAVCVTIALVALKFFPENKAGWVLFINYDSTVSEEIIKGVTEPFGNITSIKSRNITSLGSNLVCNVKVKDAQGLMKALNDIEGIKSVSLVEHDGEFRG